MQTILVTSFHAVISRNIVMAGIPQELVSRGFHVVLLVPQDKKSYFQSEYGNNDIEVVGIDTKLTKADLFLRFCVLAVTHTKGLSIKKRAKYYADHALLSYMFAMLPSVIFRGVQPVVTLLRFLDPIILRSQRFAAVFETHNPSLVFLTDLQNEMDVRLLQEAKARGIKNIGMLRSWDNISTKGILRTTPDKVLVHNEILKQELVEKNFVKAANVEVVGIPHYDSYFDPKPSDKKSFFESFHLDLSKPLILFAPIGDRYIRENKLDALILKTLSSLDANILVRLPPTDSIAYFPKPEGMAPIQFQQTGASPWDVELNGKVSKLNEITKSDEQTLIDSLYFADVVVTGQSTIAVDAVAFDKPVAIVCFDQEPRPYLDSVRRYYDYDYYRPVVESGGVSLVETPEKLLDVIAVAMKNPRAGHEGRVRLVNELVFKHGGATERLVSFISGQLQS